MLWTSDGQVPQWSGENIWNPRYHSELQRAPISPHNKKIGQKYSKNRRLSWGLGTSAPLWGQRCLKIWERRLKEILVLIGKETQKGEGDKWKKKGERGRTKRKESWCFKEGFGFGFILKLFWLFPRATKSQWSEQALPKALVLLLLTALHHVPSPTEVKSIKMLYNYKIRMVGLCTPYAFMLQKRITHGTGKWNINLL